MKLTDLDIQRFWSKVDRGSESDCWIWSGSKRNGYGAFCVNHQNKGAHRASFVIAGGTLQPDLVIRHLCNNPACVNPSHLRQGTHKENQKDRITAGTACFGALNPVSRLNPNSTETRKTLSAQKRGTKNPQAKLTDEQVASIRSEYAAGGVTQLQLANKYGVRDSQICRIIKGQRRGAA